MNLMSSFLAAVFRAAALKIRPKNAILPSVDFLGQHYNKARNEERKKLREAKHAKTSAAQKLKTTKPRKHKKYHHPLRDGWGTYTLVGREPRRKWVAGISAHQT